MIAAVQNVSFHETSPPSLRLGNFSSYPCGPPIGNVMLKHFHHLVSLTAMYQDRSLSRPAQCTAIFPWNVNRGALRP